MHRRTNSLTMWTLKKTSNFNYFFVGSLSRVSRFCQKRIFMSLEFNKRADALRESSETKENFVCDEITENNLYDFILYEMFKGDSEKMNRALADYYSDDYDKYCDDIISTWFEGEEYDE